MEVSTILSLLKARIGISTTVRDTYLTAIINGIIDELQNEKGIKLEASSQKQIMFIVDFADWRYHNRDSNNMPRHLQYRLHNLMIHNGGGTS